MEVRKRSRRKPVHNLRHHVRFSLNNERSLHEKSDVPAAPYVVASIQHTPSYSPSSFSVRIGGKLRWQVGSWTSGHYGFYVQCDAYLPVSGGRGSHSFLPTYPCRTNVWSQP
ncbi:hypothetical protein EJ110_NYTH13959 [Nymphaea thermarum]|nr:hypothetical protein EJ110_NYTH13959 [Nymphaea thermarum]